MVDEPLNMNNENEEQLIEFYDVIIDSEYPKMKQRYKKNKPHVFARLIGWKDEFIRNARANYHLKCRHKFENKVNELTYKKEFYNSNSYDEAININQQKHDKHLQKFNELFDNTSLISDDELFLQTEEPEFTEREDFIGQNSIYVDESRSISKDNESIKQEDSPLKIEDNNERKNELPFHEMNETMTKKVVINDEQFVDEINAIKEKLTEQIHSNFSDLVDHFVQKVEDKNQVIEGLNQTVTSLQNTVNQRIEVTNENELSNTQTIINDQQHQIENLTKANEEKSAQITNMTKFYNEQKIKDDQTIESLQMENMKKNKELTDITSAYNNQVKENERLQRENEAMRKQMQEMFNNFQLIMASSVLQKIESPSTEEVYAQKR